MALAQRHLLGDHQYECFSVPTEIMPETKQNKGMLAYFIELEHTGRG